MLATKIAYLLWCLRNAGHSNRLACPACGSRNSQVASRKLIVSALRRCNDCELLFRTPTTTHEENQSFYQTSYGQGSTTEMPNDEHLSCFLNSRFLGTDLDRSDSVQLLKAISPNPTAEIFDYGCSWGYGAWQLREAGFKVTAYEISEPRSRFATKNLGLQMSHPSSIKPHSFDVVYSSHVIEHVPSPAKMLLQGLRMLKPGGVFVALTPNGSRHYRRVSPRSWQSSWGQVHPQLICEDWVRHAAAHRPYYISGVPVAISRLAHWTTEQCIDGDLCQPHLFFAIRNN